MHPFTPFVTEELWHVLREERRETDIIVSSWPNKKEINLKVLNTFNYCDKVITQIRNFQKGATNFK